MSACNACRRASRKRRLVRSAGPSIGQHNDEIYAALGLTPDEMTGCRCAHYLRKEQ